MKLDGEAVLFRGTLDHKSGQELSGENIGAIDSNGLMSEHRLETKEQSGVLCGLKSGEGKIDRFFSDEDCWGIPKLDCSIHANDFPNDDEEKLRNFVSPIPSIEIEPFEKDFVFYVDKSVMEPELPELIVCYKENNYQIVKDICIDDGVPSNDKFLFDTDLDEQKLCTFLISEEKNSEQLAQGKGDPDMHIPELQVVSSVEENLAIGHPIPDDSDKKGSRSEFPVEYNLKDLDAEQEASKKVINGESKEFLSLGELLLKSSHDTVDDIEQLAQRPHENTILTRSPDVSEESKKVNEQPSLVNTKTGSTAKESGFGFASEQASLQTHSPDSTVEVPSPPESCVEESEIGSKEEALESQDKFESSRLETGNITLDGGEGSQPGKGLNSSRPEDTGTEAFSSQLHYCEGESSFSAAGGVPISGLISYSGPIAYSGSLSLRSDSSTTSTRSFAFPILQSEWNSSPVRMAKAERRCMRKQRGWRQAILCCRF